jgi:hypothetical protein
MDKVPFHGIYAFARSIVKNWRLPFFVNEYFEQFFHF